VVHVQGRFPPGFPPGGQDDEDQSGRWGEHQKNELFSQKNIGPEMACEVDCGKKYRNQEHI
jgi:hypothetical protein